MSEISTAANPLASDPWVSWPEAIDRAGQAIFLDEWPERKPRARPNRATFKRELKRERAATKALIDLLHGGHVPSQLRLDTGDEIAIRSARWPRADEWDGSDCTDWLHFPRSGYGAVPDSARPAGHAARLAARRGDPFVWRLWGPKISGYIEVDAGALERALDSHGDRLRALVVPGQAAQTSAPGRGADRTARRFSTSDLRAWYRERVKQHPEGQRPPSRDEDLSDARSQMKCLGISRDAVRKVRKEIAPSDWQRQGRRETGGKKSGDE